MSREHNGRSNAENDLRSVDRELLDALRSGASFGVTELTERLGVTATAVRQRLERMLESGLVDREKVVAGRGRPTYTYQLTVLGHRKAGADVADLADAMWREINAIEPSSLRAEILNRVAKRVGQRMRVQMSEFETEAESSAENLEHRMLALSQLLSDRRIPAAVGTEGELPVIELHVCPHPDLVGESERRSMCQLEAQMLSEALGSEVALQSCRLDGEGNCLFAPVSTNTTGANSQVPASE